MARQERMLQDKKKVELMAQVKELEQIGQGGEELENKYQELDEYLTKEMESLVFRSRAKYYEAVEKNTKYFFKLIEKRNDELNIKELIENGTSTIDPVTIGNKVQAHYAKTFTDENATYDHKTAWQFLQETTEDKLSAEEKEELGKPITLEEIRDTLFKSMNIGTSPGPDGISSSLLQTFWNKLEPYYYRNMTESMELGELPRSMKQAVIKLILKKDKVATEIKSFRPISLMACDCKIFSKLIANLNLKDATKNYRSGTVSIHGRQVHCRWH